jgi:hypothetical protein
MRLISYQVSLTALVRLISNQVSLTALVRLISYQVSLTALVRLISYQVSFTALVRLISQHSLRFSFAFYNVSAILHCRSILLDVHHKKQLDCFEVVIEKLSFQTEPLFTPHKAFHKN